MCTRLCAACAQARDKREAELAAFFKEQADEAARKREEALAADKAKGDELPAAVAARAIKAHLSTYTHLLPRAPSQGLTCGLTSRRRTTS